MQGKLLSVTVPSNSAPDVIVDGAALASSARLGRTVARHGSARHVAAISWRARARNGAQSMGRTSRKSHEVTSDVGVEHLRTHNAGQRAFHVAPPSAVHRKPNPGMTAKTRSASMATRRPGFLKTGSAVTSTHRVEPSEKRTTTLDPPRWSPVQTVGEPAEAAATSAALLGCPPGSATGPTVCPPSRDTSMPACPTNSRVRSVANRGETSTVLGVEFGSVEMAAHGVLRPQANRATA